MSLQVHGDTIETLIQERRETEKENKQLQEQIDLLRSRRLEIEKGSGAEKASEADSLADLDKQIEELTLEMRERSAKLKNICRMARTISAGD